MIDLTGQRYGRLVVIKEVERKGYTRRWLCRCDCGNERVVAMSNLRVGHTKSCGCYQREKSFAANTDDLTGKVFGRLTVVKQSETKPYKSRHVFWVCQCECGNTTIADGVHLKEGAIKSCGCLLKDSGYELQEYNEMNLRIEGVFVPSLTKKLQKNNTSGVKGVSRVRRKSGYAYVAYICLKGKNYYLGTFPTIEQAAAARKRAEEKYHLPYLDKLEEKKTPSS